MLAEKSEVQNRAVVVNTSPLTVEMPAKQWNFGLLLPVDPAVLRTCNGALVRLRVSIERGAIGVAGVNRSGEFTTPEQVVGEGEAVVDVHLRDTDQTAYVVLRTVSGDGTSPTLVLLSVDAHEPDSPRLVDRRHGLPFDLVVVLAMSKTGTQTVESTLQSISPSVRVHRTHFLSDAAIRLAHEKATSNEDSSPLAPSSLRQAGYAEVFRGEIDLVRNLGGKIAFITGVREPIDRAVSEFFHNIPLSIPMYRALHSLGPGLIDLVGDYIVKGMRKDVAEATRPEERFFRDEYEPLTGADILERPFDRDRGFTLVSGEGLDALVYRYDAIANGGLIAGLAMLTGRPNLQLVDKNRSDEKSYGPIYREFRARFRVPPDLAETIYEGNPVIRHFWAPEEREAFRSRWVDGAG